MSVNMLIDLNYTWYEINVFSKYGIQNFLKKIYFFELVLDSFSNFHQNQSILAKKKKKKNQNLFDIPNQAC